MSIYEYDINTNVEITWYHVAHVGHFILHLVTKNTIKTGHKLDTKTGENAFNTNEYALPTLGCLRTNQTFTQPDYSI